MALTFLFDRKGLYIYPSYVLDMTATGDMAPIAGQNVARTFTTVKKDFAAMYYDEESSMAIGKNLIEKVFSSQPFFDDTVRNIYKKAEGLLAFCRTIPSDLRTLTDDELIGVLETYIEKLRLVRAWGFVPVFLDGLTESYLSKRILNDLTAHLSTIGKGGKAGEYYSLLSSSEKESLVQAEERGRLLLAEKILAHPHHAELTTLIDQGDSNALKTAYQDISRLFEKHLEAFGSLTYGYTGPAMTVSHLLASLSEDLKAGNPVERRNAIEERYRTISEEKRKLMDELSLPENLRFAFQVSSELMYMKDWRKGEYQQSYLLMDPVMEELARRLGLSLKEVKYLTHEEVRKALIEERLEEYKEKLALRLDYCCYLAENGKVSVYEGEQADTLEKDLLGDTSSKTDISSVKELTGMTAYSGVVRGMVKIVLSVDDVPKVQEGDVLVSSATNPDLVMAMRKAGAFVTDSGGIISHAAIVAREMKKPCVVGTRVATHTFKDGDMVEVDADKGIVRRIS